MKCCLLLMLGALGARMTGPAQEGDALIRPRALPNRPATADSSSLRSGLADPPSEYRLMPRWVWNDEMSWPRLREQLGQMRRQGMGGVFVHPRPGLMTEYLSDDWFRLWKLAVEEGKRLGYDVIMVVLPYYSRPTQVGILKHFRAVSEVVSLPILIYNIPLFTGVNMDHGTLESLAAIPNIRGIKEEAGIQPVQATAYALRTRQDFSIYCGDDTMVLQGLPQRGVGVASGGS